MHKFCYINTLNFKKFKRLYSINRKMHNLICNIFEFLYISVGIIYISHFSFFKEKFNSEDDNYVQLQDN